MKKIWSVFRATSAFKNRFSLGMQLLAHMGVSKALYSLWVISLLVPVMVIIVIFKILVYILKTITYKALRPS